MFLPFPFLMLYGSVKGTLLFPLQPIITVFYRFPKHFGPNLFIFSHLHSRDSKSGLLFITTQLLNTHLYKAQEEDFQSAVADIDTHNLPEYWCKSPKVHKYRAVFDTHSHRCTRLRWAQSLVCIDKFDLHHIGRC